MKDASGGYGRLKLAAQRSHLLATAGVHIHLQPTMQRLMRVPKDTYANTYHESWMLQLSPESQARTGV